VASRVFVGREAELEELKLGLSDALSGRGRLYLLSGEPGIGKTRLCDELSGLAAEAGMRVVWGRCWESGGAPSYFPWLDVLASLAEMLDDVALERALEGGAALVSDLVVGVRARLGDRPTVASTPDEARFRLHRAVASLCRQAAAATGAVIILEDLHAADESSLRLLHSLARELRSMRLFVLATFRDVEAQFTVEVGEAIGRLTREGTSLSLGRLAPLDAERFVRARGGDIPARTVAAILRRSQGNPLFLDELVRLAGNNAALPDDLTLGVRDAIRGRLDRVSQETRALLEVAAVVGDEFDPAIVAEAVGKPREATALAVAESLRAGVLVTASTQRLRFSHALVREVLVGELPAERKRTLHGAVAEAIERRTAFVGAAPLSELAHHFLEGPGEGLARAVRYAIRAADRAVALSSFEDAITLLGRVRDAVEAQGAPPRLDAELLTALGRAHIRRGAGALGQSMCLEAASIARSLGDGELLAQAALSYGLELTAALVNAPLIELLNEALQVLPVTDSPLRVRVTARLAGALQPHPDLLYPIGLARGAIESARRIGEPATLLEALFTGMSAMMDIVEPRERLPLNLEIEQLASGAGDAERIVRTQARLAFDHIELGELAPADARIEAFERLAREYGADRYSWRALFFRSMRAAMQGRFEEAFEHSERGRQMALEVGDPQIDRCYVLHREGLLRAWERHDEMIAFDPEARRVRLALYSGPHWQNGGSAFTHSRLEDAERTRFYLELIPQDDWPLVCNPPAFCHLGEPLALVDDLPLARIAYDRLRPAAHRTVSWGWTCMHWDGAATRVLALLAERLGQWDEAVRHFEEALRVHDGLGALPYLARTQYEYGRALVGRRDAGSVERGRRLLDTARLAAERLTMTGLVRLAEKRLSTATPTATALPTATTTRVADALPFTFTPEGEYWSIAYDDATFRLRDSRGLHYLAQLFASPDRAIHVLELSGGKGAGADAEVLDTGDAGELLDEQARRSYQERLTDLREELAEAESFGDPTRATRAREEIEFLAGELSRAVGMGGRARRAGGAGERARSAVQRRIRNAIERIREESHPLADLLERCVKTGHYCVFSTSPLRDP
jgi:tetratricopeptide (TPR) repeat protein